MLDDMHEFSPVITIYRVNAGGTSEKALMILRCDPALVILFHSVHIST